MALGWRVKADTDYCIDSVTGEIELTTGWRAKEDAFTCVDDGIEIGIFETIDDEDLLDHSYTICFYPRDKAWRGFHSWLPDFSFSTYSKTFSFKDQRLYVHNKGPRGRFYNNVYYPSFVDAVFADNTDQQKMLQAIKWKSEISDANSELFDTPIDFITVRTNVQCSEKTPLVNITNVRKTKGSWYFNRFRDVVKRNADSSFTQFLKDVFNDFEIDTDQLDSEVSLFVQRRFVSPYFVVRFEFTNVGDKNFVLIDVNINYLDVPR